MVRANHADPLSVTALINRAQGQGAVQRALAGLADSPAATREDTPTIEDICYGLMAEGSAGIHREPIR